MAFIRPGSRLANGSRSGAYVYNDGRYINIHVPANSARRRRCDSEVRLTHEELVAIATSCLARGWLPLAKVQAALKNQSEPDITP